MPEMQANQNICDLLLIYSLEAASRRLVVGAPGESGQSKAAKGRTRGQGRDDGPGACP